jgi:hypothetical protein
MAKNISIERQTIDTLKTGFKALLRGTGMHFRKIDLYLASFDKCITPATLRTYQGLKITQLKVIVERFDPTLTQR